MCCSHRNGATAILRTGDGVSLKRLGATRSFMLGAAVGILVVETVRYGLDWPTAILAALIAGFALAVPRID